MHIREFDFELPSELIAQTPANRRSDARLLALPREAGPPGHHRIADLPALLRPGDLLVVNDTRVFPARLIGRRVPSGGAVECLLMRRVEADALHAPAADAEMASAATSAPQQMWEALVHPGQKLKPGARVVFEGVRTIQGEVLERRFHGRRLVRLWTDDGTGIDVAVDAIGHVPLPPYIHRPDTSEDRERYQTVFAHARGSVAAPTAGLHFNEQVLAALRERGVEIASVTLHVGYGTFAPVRVEQVEDHRVASEPFEVSPEAAAAISRARSEGRRVIAVGTTVTRTLEAVARSNDGHVVPGRGETDLFISPGFAFKVLDGLLTNFHLPRSSLLMLVAAFAGLDRVRDAYRTAIAEQYRFYSYGDAMLIL
ncbi:MAG: tRNA preQ1(34) S-adenosylmethionine ribosyltransferase-isomerase QueA [Vicinamibacterales bacterium]